MTYQKPRDKYYFQTRHFYFQVMLFSRLLVVGRCASPCLRLTVNPSIALTSADLSTSTNPFTGKSVPSPGDSTTINIQGKEYKRDEVTNITPRVTRYEIFSCIRKRTSVVLTDLFFRFRRIGSNLHMVQHHPLNIIKKKITDHMYKSYKVGFSYFLMN